MLLYDNQYHHRGFFCFSCIHSVIASSICWNNDVIVVAAPTTAPTAYPRVAWLCSIPFCTIVVRNCFRWLCSTTNDCYSNTVCATLDVWFPRWRVSVMHWRCALFVFFAAAVADVGSLLFLHDACNIQIGRYNEVYHSLDDLLDHTPFWLVYHLRMDIQQ